jgi:hypothetical protein
MTPAHTMQCMEVWGGNQPVDRGVVMAGLDAWVYSKPYGGAAGGGDVHYVSSCATGRITRLLVADVSGHGDAVSGVASALRGLMHRYVNYIEQTHFVRAMNEQFTTLAAAECFATAVVTSFFAPTGELSICNAGHPPPLVHRAKTGRWTTLTPARRGAERAPQRDRAGRSAAPPTGPADDDGPANTPLGILDLAEYDQFATRLSVSDMVLCYTDSLMECYDAKGQLLGVNGLLETLNAVPPEPAANLIPALLDALRARRPGNLDGDDVTVLLFRANGLAPRLSFAARAWAPLKVLGRIVGSLRPGAPPAPWPELSLPNIGGALLHVFNRSRRTSARDSEV